MNKFKCHLRWTHIVFRPNKINTYIFVREEMLPFTPFVGLNFNLLNNVFETEKVAWQLDLDATSQNGYFTLSHHSTFEEETNDDYHPIIEDMKNDGFTLHCTDEMNRTAENEKLINIILKF